MSCVLHAHKRNSAYLSGILHRSNIKAVCWYKYCFHMDVSMWMFHKWGSPKWMVYGRNPWKWMMNRGTPIYGILHMIEYHRSGYNFFLMVSLLFPYWPTNITSISSGKRLRHFRWRGSVPESQPGPRPPAARSSGRGRPTSKFDGKIVIGSIDLST